MALKNKIKVSVCVPTLGRPEKLHRLLEAIKENAEYDNYEIIVKSDEMPPNNVGAPTMLKRCVDESTGDLVLFLGNDVIPQKGFMREAVWEMARRFPDMDGLVGINDMYWDGNKGHVATHWLASKKLLPMLGGAFFDTDFFHTGVDNLLQARCEKIGKYAWAEKAKIFHDHPMVYQYQKENDEFYEQCYSGPRHDHDDVMYAKKMKEYGLEDRKF